MPSLTRATTIGVRRWTRGTRLSDTNGNPPTVGSAVTHGIVLHVNRELIHHGAEISLLRDLYRWQDSAVRARFQ